jgi:hypothetical protein
MVADAGVSEEMMGGEPTVNVRAFDDAPLVGSLSATRRCRAEYEVSVDESVPLNVVAFTKVVGITSLLKFSTVLFVKPAPVTTIVPAHRKGTLSGVTEVSVGKPWA